MKIILSSTTKGATRGILDEVKARLLDGEDSIILTTDRNAHNMERTVLETLTGLGAEFRVKVMSFTRFCVQTLGEKVRSCLTPEGSVMLLADVIEKCQDQLIYYRRVKPESLAGEVYAALTALRNSGVSTEEFREKASKLPLSLKNKAHDLSIMHDGYLATLSDKRHDSSTRLETLAKVLGDGEIKEVKNTNFFVVDMVDFNTPQLKVMEALSKTAKSLTVGLVSGFNNKNRRIYPDYTVNKVKGLSANKVTEKLVFDNLTPMQKSIAENLFAYEMLAEKEIVEVGENLSVKTALGRQDEVLSVALDIVEKVQNGARYKDFEILLGDEAYVPIVRNVFSRYGIKFFIDRKELMSEQTKVKYLLSALVVILKNYRMEEVLDFVKNPMFSLGLTCEDEGKEDDREDMVFRFENYVLEYGVNFGSFNRPFVYEGQDEKKEKELKNKIAVAERVRSAMCNALAPLELKGKREMTDFVSAARTFLENQGDAQRKHIEKLSLIDENYAKYAGQVDNKLDGVLGEIESVLVGECDLEKFNSVLTSMLKTLKIALVPTFLDSVFVGDMSSKFMGDGDMYVIGANAGALPPDSQGGAVITPKDEELFEEAEINLYPTQRQRIKQNLFTLTDILAKCSGKLTVSYSQSSSAGELNPSTIISQFEAMFKKNGEGLKAEFVSFDNLRASGVSAEKASALFATEKSTKHAVLSYGVSGRAVESDMSFFRTAYGFLSAGDKVVIDKIYSVPERLKNPAKIQNTSISRLERYFKCPYGYYLSYMLGLKPRDEGDITGLDNGTLLHAVFEEFFKALKDKRVDEESVEALAVTTFDKVVESDDRLKRLAEKPDVKRLLKKLKYEGVRTCKDLYEISLRSKFVPTYLEAEFASGKSFKPIALDVDGNRVELRGKIDRVDVYDDKFLIIDYKTFKSVTLSASEIYHGEKLQLYIYAMSIMENIDKKVAGVFYLPVFPGFVKDGQQRYKYVGQVTDNSIVREQIDCNCADKELSPVIPTAGSAGAKTGNVLGDDEFLARGQYALDIAKEGAKDIAEGYVSPKPLDGACIKCEFSAICAYKDKYPRYKYSVDNEVFLHYNEPATEDAQIGDDI